MQLGKPRGEMCPFKNSIFTQVDQRDEEHASSRRQTPELPDQMARGLIIGDGQQTKTPLMMRVGPGVHARRGTLFDTWSELTSVPAISQTNTTPCAGSVFLFD